MNSSAEKLHLLTVAHLRKTFGTKTAVEDVSFEVFGGEVFGLLGPNGAGKTTTIRMILDIFKPDAGQITVLGGPMNPARADRTGYMPEERGLYPDMKVLDCLTYLGTLKGLSRKEAKSRAQNYLERLELTDQYKTKIQTLSRGMTQKVQVIAAVLHQPDLLIIDEPFANLDPVNAQLVRDVILELRDRGAGIIMTSHQLGLVEALCDRIALIHRGKVVLHGAVREVRRQFAANVLYLSGQGELNGNLPGVVLVERRSTADWFLTLAPEAQPQAVLQALAAESFLVDRFEVALPTLDEIFIQVVKEKA
ncbi:MAG: ATP-binding cassette domain-containing protein [Anaerolineales bacterium]|nr:ATP-binding cassette domain-containing protein [Anaerolineales bacterium]